MFVETLNMYQRWHLRIYKCSVWLHEDKYVHTSVHTRWLKNMTKIEKKGKIRNLRIYNTTSISTVKRYISVFAFVNPI